MKQPGRARSARSRTSGCRRCPPLWMTRSEDRSYFADRGIVDPADQQRGHQVDVRDPVPLDQLEHVPRPGAGAEHHRPAGQQEALQAGAAERQVVLDRQHVQQHVAHADLARRRGDLGVVQVVVVGARDQLGDPGRAPGQQEQRRVGRVDADLLQRLAAGPRFARKQVLQPHEPRVVRRLIKSLYEAEPQVRAVGHDVGGHGREVEAARGGRHRQGLSPRYRRELGDLPPAVPGQGEHRGGPDAQQREVQVGEHRGVRQLDDDPVQRSRVRSRAAPGPGARTARLAGCRSPGPSRPPPPPGPRTRPARR